MKPQFKILFVDDCSIQRELMTLHFSKNGINFDTAQNGEEAILLAVENKYDIIFMDIEMPHMNGFEVSWKLRKAGVLAPIYAVSALPESAVSSKMIACGINDYIQKPNAIKTINVAIHKFLENVA